MTSWYGLPLIPKLWNDVLEEIDGIIASDRWSSSEAAKLAGRPNFYRAWDVSQGATGDSKMMPITVLQRKALEIIHVYVPRAELKELRFSLGREVTLLYRDGAIEENFAGAGAVLCLPDKAQPVRVMSVGIPEHLLVRWRSRSRHAVGEAELLPAVLARSTWTERLRGRSVIDFTDNSSVKEALVKGTSSNMTNREVLFEMAAMDADMVGVPRAYTI
eukprot:243380-Amphidinium_carterae.1